MKPNLAIIISLLSASIAMTSLAGDDYELTWYVIPGGGGTSVGDDYELIATIGQAAVGSMSGDDYTLHGGFLTAPTPSVPSCPADLNGNGSVGVPDLLQLLSCWGSIAPGSACESADLTGSSSVGVPDLLQLLSSWGDCL